MILCERDAITLYSNYFFADQSVTIGLIDFSIQRCTLAAAARPCKYNETVICEYPSTISS